MGFPFPAFFNGLKNALIVFDHGVEADSQADEDADNENSRADQGEQLVFRIQGDGGESAEQKNGDSDEKGSQTHLFAKGDTILLRNSASVIGMERRNVAFHIGNSEENAQCADDSGTDPCRHIKYSFFFIYYILPQ
jgi:hypothetical protein